jgi:hypothetical protein
LQTASDIGALNDVGRNKIHNGLFRITTRGVGPFTGAGYTLDRWIASLTNDTISFSQVVLADADRAAILDEEAEAALQNVFTGNAAAASYNQITQRIEDLRRLSGKTVQVSFWAKASSGTPKLGVSIDQLFGSGGSPSSPVFGNGQAVTLSTSWTRYGLQFAVPSLSGRTLGTNNDNYTGLNFWFSSGSTLATRAGSVGVQSNTVQIWGVQLEVGSIVTPLEKIEVNEDIRRCRRFYSVLRMVTMGMGTAATAVAVPMTLPVTMRAAPTANATTNSATNTGVVTLTADTAAVWAQFIPPASAGYIYDAVLQLSADL